MKLWIKGKLARRRSERGMILSMTLILLGVLCITLWSYLVLMENQNLSVARSQAWNSALNVAAAGVEEALAQLNPGATVTVNLNANGWGPPTAGSYGPMVRTNTDGIYAVSYTTASGAPVIISAGSTTLPFMSATLSRVVRVTTSNAPVFNVAFGTIGSISMNGNSVAVDSFNSSNTNLSTNGRYDPTKTSTNGNVASVNGPVSFGNDTIEGNLYLGPTATLTSSSNNITGTVYNDSNVTYPDVALPNVSFGFPPAAGTNAGVAYTHYFSTSGNYAVSDSGTWYIAPGANVTIEVTASSWSPANLYIDRNTTSGSGHLTVYMAGTTTTMGGNPTVQSGVAGNFQYFGLPSNTSIAFSGTTTFIGCIYAPEAGLTLNGGGSGDGFIGSCIVNTITMHGHYDFHYDQALASTGPARGYVPVSWQEL
jgi:hypothetical protein